MTTHHAAWAARYLQSSRDELYRVEAAERSRLAEVSSARRRNRMFSVALVCAFVAGVACGYVMR